MTGPAAHGTILVIAKAPVPGRVKTRLCPPCTPEEAATLARAALSDTLAAVAAADVRRRVLVLDGEPGPWLDPQWKFEVVAQRGRGLDERLDAAFADAVASDDHARREGPTVLVGMDTPQLRPDHLTDALRSLRDPGDAVLGPATDGGFWLVGFHTYRAGAFTGVPMSEPSTGDAQLQRLRAMGWRVRLLAHLDDFDSIDDARKVAQQAPTTRLAGALGAIEPLVTSRAAAVEASS